MRKKEIDSKKDLALSKQNYVLMLIGLAIIVLGYLLMTGGGTDDPNVFNGDELYSFRRITLAPILIVGGFIFEIYAIIMPSKQAVE